MKSLVRALTLTLFLLLVWRPAGALWMFEETQRVPIARVFTNLQQRLARNTNDFELTYQLARLHSMQYATNRAVIDVTKKDENLPLAGWSSGIPREHPAFKTEADRTVALQHLTNAMTFYERSLQLLKRSTNGSAWYVMPIQLGLAWSLDQSGQREKALDAYRKTLRIAWKAEVTGDFEFKQWVKDVWSDVSSGKNPIHGRRSGSLGPGPCYSDETIGYMLKLLDPVKDAKEIAQLKADQKTLSTMGRAVTPILVPLERDATLADLVDPAANVRFDLDGSGLPRRWGWLTPKAAWLVYDADESGRIESALQMFGSVTFWIFWDDGYAALKSLDDNGDGVLAAGELRHLALWRDLNSNGVSDPGEVRPLADYGITELSCAGEGFSGDNKWSPRGVTFSDGEVRPTYDWIAPGK